MGDPSVAERRAVAGPRDARQAPSRHREGRHRPPGARGASAGAAGRAAEGAEAPARAARPGAGRRRPEHLGHGGGPAQPLAPGPLAAGSASIWANAAALGGSHPPGAWGAAAPSAAAGRAGGHRRAAWEAPAAWGAAAAGGPAAAPWEAARPAQGAPPPAAAGPGASASAGRPRDERRWHGSGQARPVAPGPIAAGSAAVWAEARSSAEGGGALGGGGRGRRGRQGRGGSRARPAAPGSGPTAAGSAAVWAGARAAPGGRGAPGASAAWGGGAGAVAGAEDAARAGREGGGRRSARLGAAVQAGGRRWDEVSAAEFLRLAKSERGSKELQEAIRCTSERGRLDAAHVLKSFQGDVLALCRSFHANHVLQTCIDMVPFSHVEFVLKELLTENDEGVPEDHRQLLSIASDNCGCRVLERIIDNVPGSNEFEDFDDLMGRVAAHLEGLLAHPQGTPAGAPLVLGSERLHSLASASPAGALEGLVKSWKAISPFAEEAPARAPQQQEDREKFRNLLHALHALLEPAQEAAGPAAAAAAAAATAAAATARTPPSAACGPAGARPAAWALEGWSAVGAVRWATAGLADPRARSRLFGRLKARLLDHFGELHGKEFERPHGRGARNFSNYVFQQLLERGNRCWRQEIAVCILKDPEHLTKNEHASHVIRKWIDMLTPDDIVLFPCPCLHVQLLKLLTFPASPCLQLVRALYFFSGPLGGLIHASYVIKALKRTRNKKNLVGLFDEHGVPGKID